jgi:hypothetical protein
VIKRKRKALEEDLPHETRFAESELGIDVLSTTTAQRFKENSAMYLSPSQLIRFTQGKPQRGVAIPKTAPITQAIEHCSHTRLKRRFSPEFRCIDNGKDHFNDQHHTTIFHEDCSQVLRLGLSPKPLRTAVTVPKAANKGVTSSNNISAHNPGELNILGPEKEAEDRLALSWRDNASASNASISFDNPLIFPPKDFLELIPFIRHFDQKHREALMYNGEQIAGLKAEITMMQNASSERETYLSAEQATAAQITSELQEEAVLPRKVKVDVEDELEMLKRDLAIARETTAPTDLTLEISSLKTQVTDLTDQLAKQTRLVNKYLTEWKQVKAAYEGQKASLDEEKKNTLNLTEDLNGKVFEHEKLKEAVERLLAMPEISPLASMGFGRVGQAFIRLQDIAQEVSGDTKVEKDEQ